MLRSLGVFISPPLSTTDLRDVCLVSIHHDQYNGHEWDQEVDLPSLVVLNMSNRIECDRSKKLFAKEQKKQSYMKSLRKRKARQICATFHRLRRLIYNELEVALESVGFRNLLAFSLASQKNIHNVKYVLAYLAYVNRNLKISVHGYFFSLEKMDSCDILLNKSRYDGALRICLNKHGFTFASPLQT